VRAIDRAIRVVFRNPRQAVRFDASGIDPLSDGCELVLSTCFPSDALTSGPQRICCTRR
jgi:sortase A